MEFEYKTIEKKYKNKQMFNEELNRLGSEGWEVVNYSSKPPEKFGKEWSFEALLKRQKSKKQVL